MFDCEVGKWLKKWLIFMRWKRDDWFGDPFSSIPYFSRKKKILPSAQRIGFYGKPKK